MPIIQQNSRIQHHTITGAGIVPTVPTSEDFTDGTWLTTDLVDREFCINSTDNKTFIRIGSNIIEVSNAAGVGNNLGGSNQVITDTIRNIDLNGVTFTQKLQTRNSNGDVLLSVHGEGSVYATGVGFVSTNTMFGIAAGTGNGALLNRTLFGWGSGSGATQSNQTAVGLNSGINNTGTYQTAIGRYSGQNNTGINQTALGNSSGDGNTGDYQTVTGLSCGQSNIGNNQTASGYRAGRNNTGANQTALGYEAGNTNTATNQTTVGYQAGLSNSGTYQAALGVSAGGSNTGNFQAALGYFAGQNNSGLNQSVLGAYAGASNSGSNQTAVGYQTGLNNVGTSQSAFGYRSGDGNTGANQSAFGYFSGLSNTGSNQATYGYEAGRSNAGDNQAAFGVLSGKNNTGGSQAVFGYQSGLNNTGANQTAVGFSAGINNAGADNCNFGNNAGRYIVGGVTGNTTSSNSIYIGSNTLSSAVTTTNEIVIGDSTTGNGNNTVTIGNSSIVTNFLNGDVALSRTTATATGISYKNSVGDWNNYVDSTGLFVVKDITNGKFPFAIEQNAPNGSLRLDSSGNVGIGTSTPSQKIHVYEAAANSVLQLESGGAFGAQINLNNSTNNWRLQSSGAGHFIITDSTGSENVVNLQSGSLANTIFSNSTQFRINSNSDDLDFIVKGTTDANLIHTAAATNRVGIGTATPQAKIDIHAQGSLSTDIVFRVRNSTDTSTLMRMSGDGQLNVKSLPTSATGLVAGDIWNNSGVLNIV